MTRIIAGSAGGRRLAVPPGRGTRPTSDRAREGILLTLDSLGGVRGSRVMDLYAGSGAVGLEALSRGAEHALLVESDPRAVRAIRTNVRELGLPGARVVADKVERFLSRPGGDVAGQGRGGETHTDPVGPVEPYDIMFADPPYAVSDEEVTRVLELLRDHGWLAEDAVVAFERESRGKALVWPEGYVEERVRRYGEASVWYGRAAGNP
ncbi:RsmD family RNA methyltransferase [Nonomuraea sp. 3-1Str]|uniref:RsmD family RNA methyltransferase n=1 Tax=Nonomuraea sp. 3-1Str TaxID=2929801 RepID=UPI00286613C2|nr:RsmD family RNA methyltransferase [Nonomuraea sp. 3-1Str]MDR8409093.1 RsmD family RNA methyltransferase [Nonomuraea sp. 3-1Str]